EDNGDSLVLDFFQQEGVGPIPRAIDGGDDDSPDLLLPEVLEDCPFLLEVVFGLVEQKREPLAGKGVVAAANDLRVDIGAYEKFDEPYVGGQRGRGQPCAA